MLIKRMTNEDITLLRNTDRQGVERGGSWKTHQWLELHLFETIEQAQLLATQWLWSLQ